MVFIMFEFYNKIYVFENILLCSQNFHCAAVIYANILICRSELWLDDRKIVIFAHFVHEVS